MKSIYIIGSLKNPEIPYIANRLEDAGFEAFADWFSPGEQADQMWQEYERLRGRTYKQAINGYHAHHVFAFDKTHLDRCDAAVLVMPAGRSAHLELGYTIGRGKLGFVLFDKEPERYDVMYRFATDIFFDLDEMVASLHRYQAPTSSQDYWARRARETIEEHLPDNGQGSVI